MGAMASQITSLTIVYSTVHSGADQRKYHSSASLAFVRRPVNSPHKLPATRKMFPFDDVIMPTGRYVLHIIHYHCHPVTLGFSKHQRFNGWGVTRAYTQHQTDRKRVFACWEERRLLCGIRTLCKGSSWKTRLSRNRSHGIVSSSSCLRGRYKKRFGSITLQWRHNERDGVSNLQPHDCLLNRLFRRRSKKTSKLCVTGLCAGNSPGTGEFPAQMASYAENVSIWWRHHLTALPLRP